MKTKEQYLEALERGALLFVEKEFIEKNPQDYKELILVSARKRSLNMQCISHDYISKHPQDCQDIFRELCSETLERLSYIGRWFSTTYPDRYTNILLGLLDQGHSVLPFMDVNYIKEHLEDYKNILKISVEEFGFSDCKHSINFQYALLDPEGYETLITSINGLSALDFAAITYDYKMQHPESFQRIAQHFINHHKINILGFIDGSYIKSFPKLFKEIAIAAITSNPENIVSLHHSFCIQNPELFADIVTATPLSPLVFLQCTSLQEYSQTHPDQYQRIISHYLKDNDLQPLWAKIQGFRARATALKTKGQHTTALAVTNLFNYLHNEFLSFCTIRFCNWQGGINNYAPEDFLSGLPTDVIQIHPEIQELIIENFLEKNTYLKPLWNKIKNIETQADDLKTRREETAATVAINLFINLRYKLCVYCQTPNPDAGKKSQLIQDCKHETRIARPELEKHRGWQQFFLNFASILIDSFSLGVVPLILGDWQLFKAKTKSEQQLDEVDDFLTQENALK